MKYDLVIIGGGIDGCALARLASVIGFSVALLEKNDFGSGVTSRSTRLIHGGLRYLESGRIGLVRESLRDRSALLRNYPGLVKIRPFLIPVYKFGCAAAILHFNRSSHLQVAGVRPEARFVSAPFSAGGQLPGAGS